MKTAKAWVAFIGAIATALTSALADDIFNIDDVQQIAITAIPAIATLYGTWAITNRKERPSE